LLGKQTYNISTAHSSSDLQGRKVNEVKFTMKIATTDKVEFKRPLLPSGCDPDSVSIPDLSPLNPLPYSAPVKILISPTTYTNGKNEEKNAKGATSQIAISDLPLHLVNKQNLEESGLYRGTRASVSVLLSAMSCIVYYNNSKDAPKLIYSISTVGSNYLLNFGTGWETFGYFHKKLAGNISSSCCTTFCNNVGAIFFVGGGAIITSIPAILTTYKYSGSIWQSVLEFLGVLPLNAYALARFSEEEGTWLIKQCRRKNNQNNDFVLLKKAIIKNLQRAHLCLQQLGIQDEFSSLIMITGLREQLIKMAEYIDDEEAEDDCCIVNTIFRTLVGMAGSSLLAACMLGYTCLTRNYLSSMGQTMEGAGGWVVSNIILMTDNYLCLKIGWNFATSLYDTFIDILHCRLVKPIAWMVCGTALVFIRILPALIALFSGYGSENTYAENCPADWRETSDVIGWSSAIFNMQFLYELSVSIVLAYKLRYGTEDECSYLLAEEHSKNIIQEVDNSDETQLPQVLCSLDETSRNKLLGSAKQNWATFFHEIKEEDVKEEPSGSQFTTTPDVSNSATPANHTL
jgi:hypothetical protein